MLGWDETRKKMQIKFRKIILRSFAEEKKLNRRNNSSKSSAWLVIKIYQFWNRGFDFLHKPMLFVTLVFGLCN